MNVHGYEVYRGGESPSFLLLFFLFSLSLFPRGYAVSDQQCGCDVVERRAGLWKGIVSLPTKGHGGYAEQGGIVLDLAPEWERAGERDAFIGIARGSVGRGGFAAGSVRYVGQGECAERGTFSTLSWQQVRAEGIRRDLPDRKSVV